MVWLAALGGASPISSTGKSIDDNMQVYCFVASSSTNSWSGGLTEFSQYLAQNQCLKSNCT